MEEDLPQIAAILAAGILAKGGPGQTSENQAQYAAELYAEVLEALTRDRERMRRRGKTPAQPSEPRKSADPFYRESGEG
jgi:23S rRNA maturation mini-RNase III